MSFDYYRRIEFKSVLAYNPFYPTQLMSSVRLSSGPARQLASGSVTFIHSKQDPSNANSISQQVDSAMNLLVLQPAALTSYPLVDHHYRFSRLSIFNIFNMAINTSISLFILIPVKQFLILALSLTSMFTSLFAKFFCINVFD